MNCLRYQNYKNENTETKYLNSIRKNRILKVKNSLIRIRKIFLKNREIKIRREIEELFFKPIIALVVDKDNLRGKNYEKETA